MYWEYSCNLQSDGNPIQDVFHYRLWSGSSSLEIYSTVLPITPVIILSLTESHPSHRITNFQNATNSSFPQKYITIIVWEQHVRILILVGKPDFICVWMRQLESPKGRGSQECNYFHEASCVIQPLAFNCTANEDIIARLLLGWKPSLWRFILFNLNIHHERSIS